MQEESVQTLLEQAKRILAAARRRVPEELRPIPSGPFGTTSVNYFEDMLRNEEEQLDELLSDWLEDLERQREVAPCAS